MVATNIGTVEHGVTKTKEFTLLGPNTKSCDGNTWGNFALADAGWDPGYDSAKSHFKNAGSLARKLSYHLVQQRLQLTPERSRTNLLQAFADTMITSSHD